MNKYSLAMIISERALVIPGIGSSFEKKKGIFWIGAEPPPPLSCLPKVGSGDSGATGRIEN